MADRDYIRQAQAALGDDDHLAAIRRLQGPAAQPSPLTEAGEVVARRGGPDDPDPQ